MGLVAPRVAAVRRVEAKAASWVASPAAEAMAREAWEESRAEAEAEVAKVAALAVAAAEEAVWAGRLAALAKVGRDWVAAARVPVGRVMVEVVAMAAGTGVELMAGKAVVDAMAVRGAALLVTAVVVKVGVEAEAMEGVRAAAAETAVEVTAVEEVERVGAVPVVVGWVEALQVAADWEAGRRAAEPMVVAAPAVAARAVVARDQVALVRVAEVGRARATLVRVEAADSARATVVVQTQVAVLSCWRRESSRRAGRC